MWTSYKFLVGSRQGTGSGQPGERMYERTYQCVLNSKFIYTTIKSIYLPKEQNPEGEVHEDWVFISHDKQWKLSVYRQFHIEGFVNQYVLDYPSPDCQVFGFVTENIKNTATGWRANETCNVLNQDEFIERFELADPGEDFETYTECHLWCLTT